MFPRNALVGSPGFTLRVAGKGFSEGSFVQWDGSIRPTVFESAEVVRAEIDQADVAVQGSFIVTVADGDGRIAANSGLFEVQAPAPSLTSLSTTESPAGEPLTLQLVGDGFYVGSSVRLNGSAVPTILDSSQQLSVMLTAAQLAVVGTMQISVLNPEPGGGESNELGLVVIPSSPSLSFLSSEGATQGGLGFDLQVFGAGFRPTTRVFIDGNERTTTYFSHNQVSVAILPGDLAGSGVRSVTAANPDPSGAAPGDLQLTVRAVGASVVSGLSEIDLPANDLTFSEHTGLLYASVPSSGGAAGNTITAIDPTTGTVVGSVFVGSEPNAMAISDDGRTIWVGLDGAGAVRRVDLDSFSAGLQFPLTSGFVEEVEVLPGLHGSVAVSQERGSGSPRFLGLFVYDDGVPRMAATPGHTGANSIAVSTAGDRIYGYNNASSGHAVQVIQIDVAGVHVVDATDGLISSFHSRISFANGRLYSTSGEVIDAQRQVLAGNLGQSGGAVTPDSRLGRAFVLDDGEISVIDMNTFQFLGSVSLTIAAAHDPNRPRRLRLVRWGSDGLAFRDGVKIYILRTPLAAS